jgi:hypothetical protein
MADEYITKLANVECRGWTKVDDVWLSTEPLYDKETDLYARLGYKGAMEACAKVGGTLVSHDDIKRLHDDAVAGLALELIPVTLPDKGQQKAAGVKTQKEIDALRDANMKGREYADYHDDRVWDQLNDRKWNRKMRLANCGKHWISGAPKGGAYLMGWWDKATKKFIQGGLYTPGKPTKHNDTYHDYGTLTLAVRQKAP